MLKARESLEEVEGVEQRPTQEITSGNLQMCQSDESLPCHGLRKMPDELWLQIFRYLPRTMLTNTARVSKNWRRLSYDPTFWKKVSFDCKKAFKSGTLGYVLSRGCRSLKLNICGFEHPVFNEECTSYRLQEIDINISQARTTRKMDKAVKAGLLEILKRCRQLERIDTLGVFFDDDIAQVIGKHNTHLRELRSLGRGHRLSYEGLSAIVNGCPRLESLSIEPTHLREDTFTINSDQLDRLIDELSPKMRRLAIFYKCEMLTDQHVQRLVEKCPDLEVLDFWGCSQLTGKAIGFLAQLTWLSALSLIGCKNISLDALRGLAVCPHLHELTLNGMITTSDGRRVQQYFEF